MNKTTKICIHYPHRHVIDGGLFYFYKLAEYCSQFPEYEIYIVNYKNSKYTEIYKQDNTCNNVHFLNYEDNNEALFDENTLFITSFNAIPLLVQSYKNIKNAKVFLINFHPKTTEFLLGNLLIKKPREASKLLETLYSNNSVAFMDKACYLASKKHYKNAQEKYTPVFLDKTYEQYQNKQIVDKNEINIGCVCRLDVDKIETIINLLNNVYKLDTDKKINFHLIGDGTHTKINKL